MSNITRRGFLKAIGLAGAGLAVGSLPASKSAPDPIVVKPIKYHIEIAGEGVQKYAHLVYETAELAEDKVIVAHEWVLEHFTDVDIGVSYR